MGSKVQDSGNSAAGATSGESSAEQARKRAELLRATRPTHSDLPPGSIVNGDLKNWRYYYIPPEEPSHTRLETKLTAAGWEPCASDVKMIGSYGGRVWRIPAIIWKDMMAERRERLANRKY